MGLVVAVDTGGTFTDAVAWDDNRRVLTVEKVASSPDDPSRSFLQAVASVARGTGADVDGMNLVLHGTTVGTNALLQRSGGKVALVTTRGFRDIVELGRRTRPHNYGLLDNFEPLVPRELRFEVTERIDAAGEVIVPLAREELGEIAAALGREGVKATVVVLLHSYRNNVHEREVGEALRVQMPDMHITLSHDVLPEPREFERSTTAMANGFLMPVMSEYLEGIRAGLGSTGPSRRLFVMQSNGGLMEAEKARDFPIHTVMSGPAGGVTAASWYASRLGFGDVIAGDVGGTSFDVTLIRGGRAAMAAGRELEYNLPLRVPMIDINTIGAGGGSIAWIDPAGLLQVGPRSAGAVPGPIAYGLGGREATVTDANIVLGRLDLARLAGVGGPVDMGMLKERFAQSIASSLSLSVEDAAAGMLEVANNKMAAAIAAVSLERGHDPRDFAYVAFGGAGGLNAVAVCRELGIRSVIVPTYPGVASAIGVLMANIRYDFRHAIGVMVEAADWDKIFGTLVSLEERGRANLEASRDQVVGIEVSYALEMSYAGQTHSVVVELKEGFLEKNETRQEWRRALGERFDLVYQENYGHTVDGGTRIVDGAMVTVVGRRNSAVEDRYERVAGVEESNVPTTRQVWFDGGWTETTVRQRRSLVAGQEVTGPAVIEQTDSTTVVDPGAVARVAADGVLLVSV